MRWSRRGCRAYDRICNDAFLDLKRKYGANGDGKQGNSELLFGDAEVRYREGWGS